MKLLINIKIYNRVLGKVIIHFQKIKMALIRMATQKCFGPGRQILKQGHLSTNMYLIVIGHVVITEGVQNSITKLMENTERCKLKEKKIFR